MSGITGPDAGPWLRTPAVHQRPGPEDEPPLSAVLKEFGGEWDISQEDIGYVAVGRPPPIQPPAAVVVTAHDLGVLVKRLREVRDGRPGRRVAPRAEGG